MMCRSGKRRLRTISLDRRRDPDREINLPKRKSSYKRILDYYIASEFRDQPISMLIKVCQDFIAVIVIIAFHAQDGRAYCAEFERHDRFCIDTLHVNGKKINFLRSDVVRKQLLQRNHLDGVGSKQLSLALGDVSLGCIRVKR
jgi:hypothetical protein